MPLNLESLFVQQSYTDMGNKYTKTRAAKIIITSASVTKCVMEKIKTADYTNTKETKFLNFAMPIMANMLMAFGAGSVIDDVVNKINARYADKSAFLGKYTNQLNTHQG